MVKVGREVVCTKPYDENNKIVGARGIVVNADEINELIGVEFNKDVGGHELYSVGHNGPVGHCFWVLETHLRPVNWFLGGTCAGSTWRDILIPHLEGAGYGYFNPVVDDWTPEYMDAEIKAREESDVVLYVITPEAIGSISYVEAALDAHQRPEVVKVCFATDVQHKCKVPLEWEPHEKKSVEYMKKIIDKMGVPFYTSLQDLIDDI